jgi:hypothetical protein
MLRNGILQQAFRLLGVLLYPEMVGDAVVVGNQEAGHGRFRHGIAPLSQRDGFVPCIDEVLVARLPVEPWLSRFRLRISASKAEAVRGFWPTLFISLRKPVDGLFQVDRNAYPVVVHDTECALDRSIA